MKTTLEARIVELLSANRVAAARRLAKKALAGSPATAKGRILDLLVTIEMQGDNVPAALAALAERKAAGRSLKDSMGPTTRWFF